MKKNGRKESSYSIIVDTNSAKLTSEEKKELKEQRTKIILNTVIAANGVLAGIVGIMTSPTFTGGDMTFAHLFTYLFSMGATFIGTISATASHIDYKNLEYDIYSKAIEEGRTNGRKAR